MAHHRRRDDVADSDYVSCPVGGEWWTCTDVNYPTFIGCCSSNPCSGRMCPPEDLYPMGFGDVTTPAPDYPNHSCPYGGLWYTCADNSITFQGCCESNPCNGQGCPSSDLRAAAVHTVAVAGSSTFTVPSSIETAAPTSSPSSTASNAVSNSNHTTTVAGVAAAIAVVLTAAAGLILYFCLRRRGRKQLPHDQSFHDAALQNQKDFYQNTTESRSTSLPSYPGASSSYLPSSRGPFSPAPTYHSMPSGSIQETGPQEIMGFGITADEFDRRSKSRTPVDQSIGPVELATQRFSASEPSEDAQSPLLEPRPKKPKTKPKPKSEGLERTSRLRSRPAISDLRAEVPRSSSRSSAKNSDLSG